MPWSRSRGRLSPGRREACRQLAGSSQAAGCVCSRHSSSVPRESPPFTENQLLHFIQSFLRAVPSPWLRVCAASKLRVSVSRSVVAPTMLLSLPQTSGFAERSPHRPLTLCPELLSVPMGAAELSLRAELAASSVSGPSKEISVPMFSWRHGSRRFLGSCLLALVLAHLRNCLGPPRQAFKVPSKPAPHSSQCQAIR